MEQGHDFRDHRLVLPLRLLHRGMTPLLLREVEVHLGLISNLRHHPSNDVVGIDPFDRLQIGKIVNVVARIGDPGRAVDPDRRRNGRVVLPPIENQREIGR